MLSNNLIIPSPYFFVKGEKFRNQQKSPPFLKGDFALACGALDSGYPPAADSGMTTWHLKCTGGVYLPAIALACEAGRQPRLSNLIVAGGKTLHFNAQ